MSIAPTVGQSVHYVPRGSADGVFPPACRAATVTEVSQGPDVEITDDDGNAVGAAYGPIKVGLAVLNPTGMFFHSIAAGGSVFNDSDSVVDEPTSLCTGMEHLPGSWHWPARADGDTARAATLDALRDGPPVSATDDLHRTARLRVGRRVGRTIYAQLGPEPTDDDPLVGIMDSPALAARVVDAVNATLRE